MGKIIADYINGNVHVTLDENGTRIMETPDNEEFQFDYPESMDVSITTKCDGNCPWCYMGCTENGKHAELLNQPLFDSILPGTEVAINLNDLSHPQLFPFLSEMKKRGIIVNGTINQKHFNKYKYVLKTLCQSHLLWGLGVSLMHPDEEFIKDIKRFPNAVIHVINGILTADEIDKMMDQDLKILILGYKDLGRGVEFKKNDYDYIQRNQKYLYDNLPKLIKHFKVVSFDNNSLGQLDVKRLLPSDEWDRFYQGDEGTLSMYVDLANGTFAQSSLIDDPKRKYPITNDVRDMFNVIKSEAK